MVAGNSDGQWVQNMTTVRLASLQPIRELVTLRTITLHPSVLEDGDSKFIRKVGQLPIRLYGFLYQKTVALLLTALTEYRTSPERILQTHLCFKKEQRHL